jgi:hypothetical protein
MVSLTMLVVIGLAGAMPMYRPAMELIGMPRERVRAQPMLATLRGLAAGRSVLVMTGGYTPGVPSMVDASLATRGPGLVFLPGTVKLAAGNASQRAQAAALRPFVINELVTDLEHLRPHIVAVDLQRDRQALPADFDILAFYMSDEHFRRAWSAYTRVASIPGWDFYRRKED